MACSERLPALQGAGVKTVRAHLRHLKGDFAHAGQNSLVLVAIGVIDTLSRALVRRGLKVLGPLNAGCFIDQDAQGFTGSIQAIGEKAGIGLRSNGWLLSSSGVLWAM